MSEFNIEDCDEIIADPGSSLAQMLALQLKGELKRIKELEAENQKLREQRDAANAQIQMLNSIIAGDIEHLDFAFENHKRVSQ